MTNISLLFYINLTMTSQVDNLKLPNVKKKGKFQFIYCCIFISIQLCILFYFFPWGFPFDPSVCLISKCLEIFRLSFYYWFLVWVHCGRRTYSMCLNCFEMYWCLFYKPEYDLSWWMFQGCLKRMCFLLLLGAVC